MTAGGPDGVLVVDKSPGPTSHDVVAVARRALATSRVGHTGTLDPMASGVLVLVVGRATRLARFMTHDVKHYVAEIAFGRSTTTYDSEGTTTRESGQVPDRAALAALIATKVGNAWQTPPAYSAKKLGGEVAYKAARRDAPLDLPPVAVIAHALTLDAYDAGTATVTMAVSAGYYVRSFAHELGETLGCGAHLAGLRRTRAGAYGLAQAVPWATVAAALRGGLADQVLPVEQMLTDLPEARLPAGLAEKVRHGQSVQALLARPSTPGPVRLVDESGHLIAVAEATIPTAAGGPSVLRPVVVLS